MNGKIIHAIIFLIIATLVMMILANADPDDPAKLANQLPVLILAGLYVGILFVMYILPALTDKATMAVLASNEQVERDPLRDAQAAMARGDYEDAIELYRDIAEDDPSNRLPWVEIAKIQHDQLENPVLAIHTMRTALEDHEWPDEDTVFFMTRIADIQFKDLEEPKESADTLKQIIELFPDTPHSAGATHKLREIDRA